MLNVKHFYFPKTLAHCSYHWKSLNVSSISIQCWIRCHYKMRLCQILLIWLILPNIGKSFLVSLCLLHVTVAKCSSIVRSIFYKQCTRFFMGNVEFDFLFMAFSSGCYNLQSRNRCVKNRPTAGRKNYDTQNFSNNFIPFSPCTIGRILPCIGSHLKIYTFLWLQ